jgi:hypothetical protein
MYVAGVGSPDGVVRFLVFYSALALAALFRFGNGSQQKVDQLLLALNPSLPVTPSPRNSNINETLYTKMRNDLIHAEDRGCDPTAAIAAIQTKITEFQRDVAAVLLNL